MMQLVYMEKTIAIIELSLTGKKMTLIDNMT